VLDRKVVLQGAMPNCLSQGLVVC